MYCRLHVSCKIFYDAFNNLTNHELGLLRFSIISSSFYSHLDFENKIVQDKGKVQQFENKIVQDKEIVQQFENKIVQDKGIVQQFVNKHTITIFLQMKSKLDF